jgi:recombination protein RecA
MPKKPTKKDSKNKETKAKTKPKASTLTAQKPDENLPVPYKDQFQLAVQAVTEKFPDTFHAWVYEEDKLMQRYYDTGSVSMNIALGGFGIPQGRIVEMWGPTGGGKTSLGLELGWHIQRVSQKGLAVIDVEHKFDRKLFKTWHGGFDPELTFFIEPRAGEEALEAVIALMENPGTGAILLDSISGLFPAKHIDGESSPMAEQARLLRDYLPTITGLASYTGVSLLAVNQVRAKLEANPNVKGRYRLKKTGGYAYDHWVCTSLYVDRDLGKTKKSMDQGELTDGVRNLGHWVKVYVEKNHAGHTLLNDFELCLVYGKGFDVVQDLIERAIQTGLIQQSGAWYSVDNIKVQGAYKLKDELDKRPELQKEMWQEIQSMQLASIDERELAIIDMSQTEFINVSGGIDVSKDELPEDLLKELVDE